MLRRRLYMVNVTYALTTDDSIVQLITDYPGMLRHSKLNFLRMIPIAGPGLINSPIFDGSFGRVS